jgi:hypothetical protein
VQGWNAYFPVAMVSTCSPVADNMASGYSYLGSLYVIMGL